MTVSREELKKYGINVPDYVPSDCNSFKVTSGPRGKINLMFSNGQGFMLLSPQEIAKKKVPEIVKKNYQDFYNKYGNLKEEFFNY